MAGPRHGSPGESLRLTGLDATDDSYEVKPQKRECFLARFLRHPLVDESEDCGVTIVVGPVKWAAL